jgi:hypothetical protein
MLSARPKLVALRTKPKRDLEKKGRHKNGLKLTISFYLKALNKSGR